MSTARKQKQLNLTPQSEDTQMGDKTTPPPLPTQAAPPLPKDPPIAVLANAPVHAENGMSATAELLTLFAVAADKFSAGKSVPAHLTHAIIPLYNDAGPFRAMRLSMATLEYKALLKFVFLLPFKKKSKEGLLFFRFLTLAAECTTSEGRPLSVAPDATEDERHWLRELTKALSEETRLGAESFFVMKRGDWIAVDVTALFVEKLE
jgi:hypothetical protein